MRSARAVGLGVAVALFAAASELSAQIPTDRTYLEFSAPARIPGATLAPGMYLFVVGRGVGGQMVIDVYSADGGRLIATCLAIETALPRPAGSTTLDYPGTSPATLRAWYPAAHMRGVEFVYGASEARELATRFGVPVPHASFKAANRDLVGAFPVGRTTAVPMMRVAGPGAVAPAATGTSGVTTLLEPFDEALAPHQHLTMARRLLIERARRVPERERPLLNVTGRLVGALHSAYRRGSEKAVGETLAVIEASLTNLMPAAAVVAERRLEPLPRGTALVLERVRAHVRAFARDLPRSSRR